tara:strand:+ start:7750 stop:8619 length:870 start_codon:yes stop_codon:yes gene_type:complete
MLKKIILGTVQLGLDYGINNTHGKPSLGEAFQILNYAYDNGIRILDTAEAYGNSQEVIGLFHDEYPEKKFKIITKLNEANCKLNLSQRISENCNTLNVEQLDCYMLHNYTVLKKNEELYFKLQEVRKNTFTHKIGISLYSNEEIEDVLNNYEEFDVLQVPFNLFDNEIKRGKLLSKAKEKGFEVHTRSVFLQGLFFKSIEDLPEKLTQIIKYQKMLDEISKHSDISIVELAIQYVLQKIYIDKMLIGVDTIDQLKRNIFLASKKSKVPHSTIDKINVLEKELLNPSNWN